MYLQHTKPASVDIANPNLLAVIANEMFELVLLAPRRMCWNGFFSSSHFFLETPTTALSKSKVFFVASRAFLLVKVPDFVQSTLEGWVAFKL